MKKILISVVLIFLCISCAPTDQKYIIKYSEGEGVTTEYYTNDYVIKEGCVRFISYYKNARAQKDPMIICGNYTIEKNGRFGKTN